MKIVSTFAPRLFSFQFEETTDELTRLYEFWTDTERLFEYFTENLNLLEFAGISLEVAVLETIDNADYLYELLDRNKEKLDALFKPLSETFIDRLLPKQKTKRKWLRLYAIKIETNYYVITGGAIKQSEKMQGHPDTAKELEKLEKCRNYLISEGIFDNDSLVDYMRFDI